MKDLFELRQEIFLKQLRQTHKTTQQRHERGHYWGEDSEYLKDHHLKNIAIVCDG